MKTSENTFDIIVLGAGHAGCEAALSAARMGRKVLCLTLNLDAVALMACNPAIGGTSKGHVVREIDALGGEMGLATDECYIQMRMLNTGKGVSVHSLRAQTDKRRYHERMKSALEQAENLTLRQGECVRIYTRCGKVTGILCSDGTKYFCKALIISCGVYLKSRILIGTHAQKSGPSGLLGAYGLSKSLEDHGFSLRRFKTGTPPRVDGKTVDFHKMEVQHGDIPTPYFSFLTSPSQMNREQEPCYLTYTNTHTHDIIKANLHRSAMYSGMVKATGTRYCPSIEDKLVRFADKDRHQLFVEPEGLSTNEMYIQGMSTSLPADVQTAMLHTVPGLEHCNITRMGYAIEYDCIDSTRLDLGYSCKDIEGLFAAGQINGSSGYEEAAAQGLLSGINAALYVTGDTPLHLTRANSYIGVLTDDLSTKGTNEPYRMMTSRAEYRLYLRQDNADLRLTELGRRTGLISDERYTRLMHKKEAIERIKKALSASVAPSEALQAMLTSKSMSVPKSGVKLYDLLKREGLAYTDLLRLYPDILPNESAEATEQVEISAKYEGYIKKQEDQLREFHRLENMQLPPDMDYMSIQGLRIEARQKLTAIRPQSIGQASRISGVSPADIAVLMVKIKKG
ncbi:MAG: tRNA uridine-5-carboxymethylaminomethyl(34) synthesis enzyme MnmG [Clostridia bacterium]|nr:tRNA uridine-5-carboxymethylaminomethyl(34) synthesis enzyme MnmG [Clostridia bacterium]